MKISDCNMVHDMTNLEKNNQKHITKLAND